VISWGLGGVTEKGKNYLIELHFRVELAPSQTEMWVPCVGTILLYCARRAAPVGLSEFEMFVKINVLVRKEYFLLE